MSKGKETRVDSFALTQHLRAVMTWPNDSISQRAYLDVHEQDYIDYAVKAKTSEVHDLESQLAAARKTGALPHKLSTRAGRLRQLKKERKSAVKGLLTPFVDHGGLKTVVDAASFDQLTGEAILRTDQWGFVGALLYVVAQLATHHGSDPALRGGPSLNEAEKFLAVPFNRRGLKLWSEFKWVRHIAAGALQAAMEMNLSCFDVLHQNPVMVLDRAVAFQHFALCHHSKRSGKDASGRDKRLLIGDECWFIWCPGMQIDSVADFLPPLSRSSVDLLRATVCGDSPRPRGHRK